MKFSIYLNRRVFVMLCSVIVSFPEHLLYYCSRTAQYSKYRIRPNYRTVRSGFSKLQRTLICGKICIYLLRIHYKKRSEKNLFDDDYAIFSDFLYKGICCGYSFVYVVGTHLNCIDKSMQFK